MNVHMTEYLTYVNNFILIDLKDIFIVRILKFKWLQTVLCSCFIVAYMIFFIALKLEQIIYYPLNWL